MPKISIIIPAREEEKVIGETVRRLNKLTIPHEIVVSDDCSEDRTSAVAREAGARVIRFCNNRHTPGASRNKGAESTSGEFIAFVDSDVSMPDTEAFYRRALEHFKNPDVVGVCGPQRARPEVETWGDRISFGILNAALRFNNNVLRRGEASGKNMIVRRDAYQKVGGFREDIATREDGDFFHRLSKTGRTLFDPSLLVFHGARRAHRVGWLKLWAIWLSNMIYFALFNRTLADEWTPVR